MCLLSSPVGVIQWDEVADLSHCVITGSGEESSSTSSLLSVRWNTESEGPSLQVPGAHSCQAPSQTAEGGKQINP